MMSDRQGAAGGGSAYHPGYLLLPPENTHTLHHGFCTILQSIGQTHESKHKHLQCLQHNVGKILAKDPCIPNDLVVGHFGAIAGSHWAPSGHCGPLAGSLWAIGGTVGPFRVTVGHLRITLSPPPLSQHH